MGGRALGLLMDNGLQGVDRPDWQGQDTCTARVRPDCRAEQSIALEMVPGPGRQQRVEPPAPKWQNSGSSTAHSFFHGDGTAALPQGPTGCPLLSPEWPQRRVCGQELRVQSPATERGNSWARMCPDGPRGYFQIPPHQPQPLGPVPISEPTFFHLALPLLGPPLLSAFTPRSIPLALG